MAPFQKKRRPEIRRPEFASYEMASKANNQRLLDELEQNIVICRWRADQLRLRQIIDPRDTDKSRYYAITEFNNCFIIRSPSLFFNYLRSDLPFSHAKAIAGRRKAWFLLGKSRIFFAPKHKPNTIGRHCAWADNYLKAVICRSRVRLSANEKEEKFAFNDKIIHLLSGISGTITHLRVQPCK